MKDRVMGIENEFGVLLEKDGETRGISIEAFDTNAVRHAIGRGTIPGSFCTQSGVGQAWFANGSLLYLDVASQPEFASCECRRVRDLVLYSKAGERIAAKIFEEPLKNGWRVLLFKNNLGYLPDGANPPQDVPPEDERSKLRTMGCHENYLVFDPGPFNSENTTLFNKIAPFLITRQIMDGAGWWMEDGTFLHSQRALMVNMKWGPSNPIAGTGPSKIGILFQRDEPHVGKEYTGHMKRFQIIMGDANILEVATFLKFGTTALVLALIEDEEFSMPACLNPVEAIHGVASDAGGKTPLLRFEDGNTKSALEVQGLYLEKVRRYVDGTTFTSDESRAEAKETVALWEQALNAIASSDEEWMLGRLDWATKRFIAEEAIKKQGATGEAAQHIRKTIDILYHAISDPRMRERLNARWGSRRILTDEEIEEAIYTPPKDTRAYSRGRIVQAISGQDFGKMVPAVGWASIGFGSNRHIYLDNPLESKDLRISLGLEDFLGFFGQFHNQIS